MKQYLYMAITLMLIAIWAVTGIGCAAPAWQSKCIDNTLLAISTVGKEYPVRGILGHVARGNQKGALHIQAEYFRGGKWRPLQVLYWSEVWEGEHEFELTNVKYLTGIEILSCYERIFKDRAERQ